MNYLPSSKSLPSRIVQCSVVHALFKDELMDFLTGVSFGFTDCLTRCSKTPVDLRIHILRTSSSIKDRIRRYSACVACVHLIEASRLNYSNILGGLSKSCRYD